MKNKIYTYGYAGAHVQTLHNRVLELNALLADIRYAPFSRQAGWSGSKLRTLFGEKYLHVPELGNVNYKNGESIAIADLQVGMARVIECLDHGPVVLLCVCRNAATCHRSVVAHALQREGFTVEELRE